MINNSSEIIDLNYQFAQIFTKIFDTEIIYMLPQDKINTNALHLYDKETILSELQYDVEFVFTGFNQNIKLYQAINNIDFHLSILAFFKRYGNLYRKVDYLDDKYEETVSIALYNPFTKTIEVITKSISESFTEKQNEFIHLQWLSILKQITFYLLTQLGQRKIDSYLIKNHSNEYTAIQNRKDDETIEIEL